jgi:uncharacterized membrane protein YiaA
MWGRYWLHLSDLTNRNETPPFSPAWPLIRSGLLESTSFQKSSFCTHWVDNLTNRLNPLWNGILGLKWSRYNLSCLVITNFLVIITRTLTKDDLSFIVDSLESTSVASSSLLITTNLSLMMKNSATCLLKDYFLHFYRFFVALYCKIKM